MERLADCAPSGFRILDETGILCDQFIEIWAGSSETPNSDREFEYEEGDTKLYFGPQSELFVQSVHLITDYDESDWGHDQEWTIKIFPGEPYDLVQRRSIYRMLARLRQETEGNISFWTRYLHTIGESEASDVISELLEAILSSSIDIDGTLLALAYKSVNDSHPGELTDTFRLLELIVKRILESLIRVRRPDQRLSDEEFVKLIRVVTSNDLAAKIGFVLENAQVEHEVLENVWNSIERKRGFNAGDLAPSIVRFRNRIAHGDTQAEDLQNLVLPWEMPNYGIVLFNMRRFLTAIIRNDYY